MLRYGLVPTSVESSATRRQAEAYPNIGVALLPHETREREEAPAEGASDEDVSSDLWGEFHIVLMLEDETELGACKT